MKEYSLRNSQPTDPLPFVLLVGLLIGITLSWVLFNGKASPTQPVLTETSAYRPTISTISTATPDQALEITPTVDIQPTLRVGDVAPDFALKTVDGQEIKLSYLKGKAVLINLCASWSLLGHKEMQEFQSAYEKYKDKGLVVLGIDFNGQHNFQDIIAFVKGSKLTYPILLDNTGKISVGLYKMHEFPTSFFINPDGILERIQVGAMPPDKLESYLAEILPK